MPVQRFDNIRRRGFPGQRKKNVARLAEFLDRCGKLRIPLQVLLDLSALVGRELAIDVRRQFPFDVFRFLTHYISLVTLHSCTTSIPLAAPVAPGTAGFSMFPAVAPRHPPSAD